MNLILEVGLNHFGKINESKKYLDFFLNSNYKYITYQIQKETFYKKFNFKLPITHYKKLIESVHKKNKKIGLAVADLKSCRDVAMLNFDFYKILSISLTNKELIDFIKKFKKPIFISCGTASNHEISQCVSRLKSNEKKRTELIHTSLSYEDVDQNLKRIELLRNYSDKVAYGHHYKNFLPIILLLNSNIKNFFIYIKTKSTKKRNYPDDKHAFSFTEIKKLNNILDECKNLFGSKYKRNKYIKTINDEKISF